MANDFVTVTRTLVKRGWTDFEPKVIAGLLSGSAGAFLIPIAAQFGIHLTVLQANYLVVGFYFLGSYITPSTGTTITTHDDRQDGVVDSETHSGNVVSTITNSTPIQSAPPLMPPPVIVPLPDNTADRFMNSRYGIPDNATQVINDGN